MVPTKRFRSRFGHVRQTAFVIYSCAVLWRVFGWMSRAIGQVIEAGERFFGYVRGRLALVIGASVLLFCVSCCTTGSGIGDDDEVRTVQTAKGTLYVGDFAWMQEDSGREAIQTCMAFPLGSARWQQAFWNMSLVCNEGDIRDYVLIVVESRDPTVRALCYRLGAQRRWPFLLDSATKDSGSRELPAFVSMPPSLAYLGDFASEYLDVMLATQDDEMD